MTGWLGQERSDLPREFTSQRTGDRRVVRVEVREDVAATDRETLSARLADIDWNRLRHAYGPADDVPALLYAVTLGTEDVRRDAWWELWGNVHHQGTVYEATPACVPFLTQIGADAGHPERVNALAFLRFIAVGDGEYAAATRAAVGEQIPGLLDRSEEQPELIQRALLLLASAFPVHLAQHPGLPSLLPPEHQAAWTQLLEAGGNPEALPYSDDDFDVQDRQSELESWAFAGWHEPAEEGRAR